MHTPTTRPNAVTATRRIAFLLAVLAAALAPAGQAAAQEPSYDFPPGVTAEPLPAREEGPTRFEQLDPKASGIQFQNVLLAQNRLPYLYSGSGVAVADYDGDDRPDVYLISLDGKNQLFRQLEPQDGQLRFEDVTDKAGVDGGDAWGWGATFADIDADGDLDLYVANIESKDKVYRNNGDGTFTEIAEQIGLGNSGASAMPAFADFDRDGDLDLYLLRNRAFGMQVLRPLLRKVKLPGEVERSVDEMVPVMPDFANGEEGELLVSDEMREHIFPYGGRGFSAGQSDRFYRNDGGRFVDVTEEVGISDFGMGLSVTWWDYDDDGWLDLYIANDLHWPDQLYRNQRDGTFRDVTDEALPSLAFFGMGSDFGDIDQDGRFDLMVADMAMRRHYDGKILMGDMDQQGWFLENGPGPQLMRNNLFLNTGTGRFLEVANLTKTSKTNWTWTVRFGDLDSDGWLDVFVTNGIPRFGDHPDIGAEFDRLWAEGKIRDAIRVASTIPPKPERNIALRNLGPKKGGLPKFAAMEKDWGLDELGVGQGAVLVDLDRDGDLDTVVNNQNQDASVFVNRGGGAQHLAVFQLRDAPGNTEAIGARIRVQAGDLRLDRLIQPVRGFLASGEAQAIFGLGDQTQIDSVSIHWPDGRRQELGALPSDHRFVIRYPDTAVASVGEEEPTKTWFAAPTDPFGFEHQEAPFFDFAEQPLVPHRHSRLGPALAHADVDGDGDVDLFVGGARGQPGALLLNTEGRFTSVSTPFETHASHEDLGATFFDADGDGDLDLYVASGSNEADGGDPTLRDRLYRNDGKGRFTHDPEALPETAESTMVVRAADIDGDGDQDLFVGGRISRARYPYAPASSLLLQEDGRFVDASASLPETNLGLVTDAEWIDLDQDGRLDLVTVAHWSSPRAFRNTEVGFVEVTTDFGLDALNGQWMAIEAGDLDGDGDLDLVTTNLGTNTKYSASKDKPMRLYVDDFDDDGTLDVIEAKWEGSTLLPVRGRSCSSRAIPMLGEKFPTFDEFAKSDLAGIYGSQALKDAELFEVTDLHHTVWRREGDRFVPEHLPMLSQAAPARGLRIADLDGDGLPEIVLGQNFFPNEPETGRMSAGFGLVIRCTKDGFDVVPPIVSGLILPEDCVDLIVEDLDGDGRDDLCAAINSGGLRLLRRQ